MKHSLFSLLLLHRKMTFFNKLTTFAYNFLLLTKSYLWLKWNKFKYLYYFVKSSINVRKIDIESITIKKFHGRSSNSNKSRICIFAHYDINGAVHEYVYFFIKSLIKAGCDIIFVSTSENLSDGEIDKLQNYCKLIIVRKNIGYDFGSWKTGISEIENIEVYDNLILTNDSIFGPLFDLKDIFRSMTSYDFWGITESNAPKYHIQSYFMVFNSKLINSKYFNEFWYNYKYHSEYQVIVKKYEIGLSSFLQKHHFKIGSFCNYNSVSESYLKANPLGEYFSIIKNRLATPTYHLALELIENHNCPFIKRKLLLLNEREPSFLKYLSAISQKSNYDIKMIVDYIKESNNPCTER